MVRWYTLCLFLSLIFNIGSPLAAESQDGLRVVCHVAMPWVVGNQVVEPLIYVDNENNFVPHLAASYKVHNTHMDVELRKGILFHDGTPFDASSVVGNWEAYRRTANPYFTIDLRLGIRTIEELSSHRIRLWFKNEGFIGLIQVLLRSFYIYSPSYFVHSDGKYPSGNQANMLQPGNWGTGPYILKDVRENGGVAVLEGNPGYWQEGRPKSRNLLIYSPRKFDGMDAHALMKRGEADLFDAVSPSMLPMMTQSDSVSLVMKRPLSSLTTTFNMRKPDSALRDIRVRKALNLLIDRNTLFKYVARGRARMTAFILPLSTPGHDLQPYPYNPEEAKALLNDAGYSNNNPLELSFGYFISEKKLANSIATMLEEGGVRVTFHEYRTRYEWYQHFMEALHGPDKPMESETWDLNIANIGLYTNSVATHFGECFASDGGYRWILPDTKVDVMFADAMKHATLEDVEKSLLELERYLYKQYYMMPIYITPTILAVNKRIEKNSFSASGYLLNLKEIEIE